MPNSRMRYSYEPSPVTGEGRVRVRVREHRRTRIIDAVIAPSPHPDPLPQAGEGVRVPFRAGVDNEMAARRLSPRRYRPRPWHVAHRRSNQPGGTTPMSRYLAVAAAVMALASLPARTEPLKIRAGWAVVPAQLTSISSRRRTSSSITVHPTASRRSAFAARRRRSPRWPPARSTSPPSPLDLRPRHPERQDGGYPPHRRSLPGRHSGYYTSHTSSARIRRSRRSRTSRARCSPRTASAAPSTWRCANAQGSRAREKRDYSIVGSSSPT